MRRPLKKDALDKLKALQVPVKSVIDVGVLSGTFELRDVYKSVPQLLIEPIAEWNEKIIDSYKKLAIFLKLSMLLHQTSMA